MSKVGTYIPSDKRGIWLLLQVHLNPHSPNSERRLVCVYQQPATKHASDLSLPITYADPALLFVAPWENKWQAFSLATGKFQGNI